jgi:uncharacterized membrane-anchored protein
VTKKKERISTIKKEMKETGKKEEELKLAINNVNCQIDQVKLAISSRKLQDISQEFLTANHLDMIRKFFGRYSTLLTTSSQKIPFFTITKQIQLNI